ncbi:MAG: NRDE family protein [Betaproteobacteria bacterium]
MCLIAFAWNAHPDYRLIVGANRDEWHERPTAPAHWWRDHPEIFAGRDLQAGGTWLGVSKRGRFAALTNFRDPSDRKSGAPSRGNLVSGFLGGTVSASDYLAALQKDAARFQGFNLLVGDDDGLFYFSSRRAEIVAVTPGVHAVSNHVLDEPWPKVEGSKSALEAVLRSEMAEDGRKMAIYEFLSSDMKAPDAHLPETGIGQEWERILSPAMIVTEKYGTRCSTVLSISAGGEINFEERTRDNTGAVTGIVSERFLRG